MEMGSPSNWLISLGIMAPSLVHGLAGVRILSLLTAERYAIVQMGHVLLVYLSTVGHSGCFHLLACVVVFYPFSLP